MTHATSARLAWALFAACLPLYLLALLFTALYRSLLGDSMLLTAFLVMPGVGALIASRKPDNTIGWLLLVTGIAFGVAAITTEYTALSERRSLPLGPEAGALAGPAFVVCLVSGAVLVPLLFPDGRPQSTRWRWVVYATGVALLLGATGYLIKPGPLDIRYVESDNPFGVEGAAWVLSTGVAILVVSAGAAALSLLLRFRRARGDERQQMKWFVFAALLMVVAAVVGFTLEEVFGGGDTPWLPFYFLLFFALPASIGIAILRHRLYDIDRIINRTLTYGLLTAVLAGVYAGLVVGLQSLLQPLNGGSDLALAVTTLIVAALFLPAQRRVQVVVNRRFNRRTYDTARAIDAFNAHLREPLDMDTLRYELLAVVSETMQPSAASLWLRETSEAT